MVHRRRSFRGEAMTGWKSASADGPVLQALRQRMGHHQTVGCLCQRLDLSPQMVTGAIRELQCQGYEIEEHPGLGYRLIATPDRLSSLEIGSVLKTSLMGRPVYTLSLIHI